MTFDPYRRLVRDEMSKGVVWLQSDDSVLDALTMMEREHVTALPVLDSQDRCVGIVSATDLIAATRRIMEQLEMIRRADDPQQRDKLLDRLLSDSLGKGSVANLMRQPVQETTPDMPIAEAGKSMLRRRIHHLPVVDQDQRLLGILSTLDLVAVLAKAARAADNTTSETEHSPHD